MGIEAIGNEMPFVGIGGTTNLPKFASSVLKCLLVPTSDLVGRLANLGRFMLGVTFNHTADMSDIISRACVCFLQVEKLPAH